MECISKLQFVVIHLGDLGEGRKILRKSDKSIEHEGLTVCGITEEGQTVYLKLIKKLKKEDTLVQAVVVLIDLCVCFLVLFKEDSIDLYESCLKLCESYTKFLNECSVDSRFGNAGEVSDVIVEEVVYCACVISGNRELIVVGYLSDYCCSEYRADIVSECFYRSIVIYDIRIKCVLGILVSRAILLRDVGVEYIVHNMLNKFDGVTGGIVADDRVLDIVKYDVSAELNDELD